MPVRQKDATSVLFVCTGNLCRSPMAEIIFKHILEERYSPTEVLNWNVASAGTWAEIGEQASVGAQKAMARRRLNLDDHYSQPISEKLLRNFKLVLVMEAGHKEALQAEFPQYANKIYLLSEMVGEKREVDDPMGGRQADYERAAFEIEDLIVRGFTKIVQLAT